MSWINDPGRQGAVEHAFRRAYIERHIPLSTDRIYTYAKSLAETDGIGTAGVAVASHSSYLRLPSPDHDLNFRVVSGMVAAALLHHNVAEGTPKVVAAQLDGLRSRFSGIVVEADEQFKARTKEVEGIIAEARDALARTDEEIRKTWTRTIEESVAKIEATNAAFTKQMQLKAPVQYWNERATHQRGQVRLYLLTLAVFVSIAIVLAYLGLTHYLPILLSKSIKEAPSSYAVAATLTTIGLTIVFWTARVLVRLFLSAHHLAVDARERTVMIQTYLALLKEGQLDEKERALILTPLFRPSVDGIVKDEGAPDLSLASLIARILDRRP